MKLSEFKEKYRISDAPAQDALVRVVGVSNLRDALETIINDNFRGAAELESCVTDNGYVELCLDYLAIVIKSTLSGIFGREFVKFSLQTEDQMLKITVNVGDISLFTPEQLNDITRAARSAKTEIEYIENGFVLTAKIAKAFAHTVYALSGDDIASRLGWIIFTD